jgi:hypothetical protein
MLLVNGISLAEDCDDCDDTGAATAGVLPFFPEHSEHPGLLGKPYFDVRYLHSASDDLGWWRQLDESLQGMLMTSNLPLRGLDDIPGPFRFDLYTEFQISGLYGDRYYGPPDNFWVELDAESRNFGLAVTAYVDHFDAVRPFIQLGALWTRRNVILRIEDDVFGDYDSETSLLLNVGLEADLHDRLAARLAIDFNTREEVDDSVGIAELIYWPFRRTYVRGGFYTPLELDAVGGLIGMGVVF